MTTQVIVTNWKRPDNVAEILKVLNQQTIPFDKIVVVNNGDICPLFSFNDYWQFPDNNIGPPCRFAPALIDWQYEYTLFLDDDLLPGTGMHENLLNICAILKGEFATLGEVGRIYDLTGGVYSYVTKDIRRSSTPRRVDLTCRAHFVRTEYVLQALIMRQDVLKKLGPPAIGSPDDWTRHDDILLCTGIQRLTGYSSYLTPVCNKDQSIESVKLDEPHAMWHKPGHVSSRETLIRAAQSCGWASII